MIVQSFNSQIKEDLEKYQNVLGKENWSKTYLSFTNEIIPTNSLIVLGGRPRTGKTSLLLDFIARNSLKPKKENEVFLNDIMSRRGLVYFIGHKKEIILRKWFSIVNQSEVHNKMNDQEIDYIHRKYLERTNDAEIDFNFYETSEEVAKVMEQDIKRTKPDYIIVDSLIEKHNVEFYDSERYELKDDVITTSVDLQKSTSKLFLISITLGHDAFYRHGNKRHGIEDLHSIELESKADVIIVLHRPELYDLDIDEEGNSLKNVTEIYSVLNRYGKERIDYYWNIENGIPVPPFK